MRLFSGSFMKEVRVTKTLGELSGLAVAPGMAQATVATRIMSCRLGCDLAGS